MPVVQGFTVTLGDRVREQTRTVGTGTFTLDGAVSGYRAFQTAIPSGERTVYTAVLGSSFETGIGVVTADAPSRLSRDLILTSSNAGNRVNWTSGAKDIFVDAPAALLNQVAPPPPVGNILSGIPKISVFTNSGTWTRDPKCISAFVRGVGGGGAGGGAAATGSGEASEGGGGGGGEYGEGWFSAAELGSSRSVTIPALAGGITGGNGNDGGMVSFGSLMTFFGGIGGAAGVVDASGSDFAQGGAGGSGGSGGYLHVPGSDGGPGRVVVTGSSSASTAIHGSYGGPAGGLSGSRSSQGQDGQVQGSLFGGGGTGAINGANDPARPGGNGRRGIVIVEEWLST